MLLNQEIGMLAVLLSGILESYLEYKAKKTWVAYAARFFAFLAMALLIITNYMYFTVPEKMSIPTKVDNNKFNFLLSLFFIILPSLK